MDCEVDNKLSSKLLNADGAFIFYRIVVTSLTKEVVMSIAGSARRVAVGAVGAGVVTAGMIFGAPGSAGRPGVSTRPGPDDQCRRGRAT